MGKRVDVIGRRLIPITDHPLTSIDALRGNAITLVVASHAFPMIHELQWSVKRFIGVQLFFMVSCFTLARSWRRRERGAWPGLREFAFRRLFRIAPAYFFAALCYFWLWPDATIDVTRIATFLTFTNHQRLEPGSYHLLGCVTQFGACPTRRRFDSR